MKALGKITLRNIRLNKKRAWVTIIGIMLATALIVVVADMAASFRASMVEYEKVNSGDYHYCFHDVAPENLKYFQENRSIERIGYSVDMGYTELADGKNPDKPYLFLRAMDENAMKTANVTLVEGRLPENSHEVVISETIRTNGRVTYQLGDVIQLTNNKRQNADGIECDQTVEYVEGESLTKEGTAPGEYTVVGVMERLMRDQEQYYAPGYTVITKLESPEEYEHVTVYATYTKAGLKNREAVTAGLMGVSEELYQRYENGGDISEEEWKQLERITPYVECNIWLLKYELLLFSSGNLKMLYSMAGIAIAIIIVTSVFCIRNSFVISLTEKQRLYGILSSIGTTRRQRKKLIYGEAFALGVIGIPLGIALGLLAGWIVVKVAGHLMLEGLNIDLVYVISIPAIIIGVGLAFVTLALSAAYSARKAAKLSPIQAIRGNESIKISPKEIRMPHYLESWFGVGGKIAYKNLRRARVKYRTTIISIVVSVAAFIGMTGFMKVSMEVVHIHYEECDYQLAVYVDGLEQSEEAKKIAYLEGVNQAEIVSIGYFQMPTEDVKYSEQSKTMIDADEQAAGEYELFTVVALDPDSFREYEKQQGVTVENTENQAFLISEVTKVVEKGNTVKYVTGDLYDYRAGDVLTGVMEETENPIEFHILKKTTEQPMGLNIQGIGVLVVSSEWLQDRTEGFMDDLTVYIDCEDPDAVETEIRDNMNLSTYSIYNLKDSYEASKALFTLIGIFVYGFIIVIALIGITNIFNTITTNMELRSREFATLKSIGMTKKEFRRVIWLESLFYGVKSLLIGVPVGILLSIAFHYAMGNNIEAPYQVPWLGIVIAVGAVFMLLFSIMRYSMGKINRKNIIETIQNENI